MPQLIYHPAFEKEESDAIPFPGPVSRIGRWQPKPLVYDAEQALDQVHRHLGRLAELLEVNSDDDRPRAA